MGRRKKAPASFHREAIADAAERLFTKKGIDATTMDDIAKEAGYSKATLYAYFQNKGEITGLLVLKSMGFLYNHIKEAISGEHRIKEQYLSICRALAQYQEQFPFYFSLTLGKINVDFEQDGYLEVEKDTYDIGEQINREIVSFLQAGIVCGELRPELPLLETVLLLWASLSGIILAAANKEVYFEKALGIQKHLFLEHGFSMLYRSIAKEANT